MTLITPSRIVNESTSPVINLPLLPDKHWTVQIPWKLFIELSLILSGKLHLYFLCTLWKTWWGLETSDIQFIMKPFLAWVKWTNLHTYKLTEKNITLWIMCWVNALFLFINNFSAREKYFYIESFGFRAGKRILHSSVTPFNFLQMNQIFLLIWCYPNLADEQGAPVAREISSNRLLESSTIVHHEESNHRTMSHSSKKSLMWGYAKNSCTKKKIHTISKILMLPTEFAATNVCDFPLQQTLETNCPPSSSTSRPVMGSVQPNLWVAISIGRDLWYAKTWKIARHL